MNKLEHYLDQVCRGVGGPRSLRQHIRQELREHLLDAAAEHRSAGMTEEQALDRALDDFGGPEQVRSELEATHGHHLMAVVIDKALQWKERTMKAKWFWTTWVHLVLLLVIVAQVAFVWAVIIFIWPRFMYDLEDSCFDATFRAEPVIVWAESFLGGLLKICQNQLWIIVPLVLLWGLFEWRVRSENKPFMRLSALATAALAMMVVVALTAAALVLPLMLEVMVLQSRPPEPIVLDRLASIDASIATLNQALAENDWKSMQQQAGRASKLADNLSRMGAAAPAILSTREQSKVDALRSQLRSAREYLTEAKQAIWVHDADRLRAALKEFSRIYDPLRQPTTQPAP